MGKPNKSKNKRNKRNKRKGTKKINKEKEKRDALVAIASCRGKPRLNLNHLRRIHNVNRFQNLRQIQPGPLVRFNPTPRSRNIPLGFRIIRITRSPFKMNITRKYREKKKKKKRKKKKKQKSKKRS